MFSWGARDGQVLAFISAVLIGAVVSALLWLPNRRHRHLGKRDIFVIVTVGWLFVSAIGMVPYLAGGTVATVTDAFFETVSGFTTTGATILTDIEATAPSVLLWRSLTQWIGGMGIVVLMIAVLPILGFGGMQLFTAESPGVTIDRLRPRIKETALLMWVVYATLTIATFLLLVLGGLSLFDAVNHALTTLSTGGFSTKQASVAAFAPHIQYILAGMMLLAGINFALLYTGLTGRIKTMLRNEELRAYLLYLAVPIVFITFFAATHGVGLEEAFRDALFQVISIVTTTGYITADYTLWAAPLIYVIFVLMFVGGMTGSTAGGVKIMRHVVLIKDALLEFRKQLHPNAILPLRFNGVRVNESIIYRVMAFVMLYILIACCSVIVLLLFGLSATTSVGAVAATLGNIGPGLGAVGPVGDYALLPNEVKGFLSALMIVGRLELFTVLILFTPYFWRKY
jgi:trk system potassium uptake protein TrkH